MKRYCIPADFKRETIDGYDRLATDYKDCRVIETYGNVTVDNCFGSGRSVDNLPRMDLAELGRYIGYCAERDIGFAYTINASTMQNWELTEEGIRKTYEFLGRLHDAGVRCLVIAMPSMIELARTMDLGFEIKASVIGQVTSVNKALAFKNMGVRRITIDECINRDFDALRRLVAALGEDIEIIANSVCHQDCHYRPFHYNQISADSIHVCSGVSSGYFPRRCAKRLYEERGSYFKATWIRPEDIHYYTGIGITNFKLQGRQSVMTGDPVRAVECYFKEHHDGNLEDLLYLFSPPSAVRLSVPNGELDGFLKPFYENSGFCKRDCLHCNYCDAVAKRFFDNSETRDTIESSLKALSTEDPFSKMIESVTASPTTAKETPDGSS